MTTNLLKHLRFLLAATIGYLCLALAGTAQEQDKEPINPEPPVRLKKKNPREAKPDEKKPDEKKPVEADPREKTDPPKKEEPKQPRVDGPGAEDPAPMEDESKKTLERISKNMRASEDRIAKKDLDEGTKQVQQDIIKDLDSLINQKQQQQQQQAGGGGGQQARNQKNQQNQKNGQKNGSQNANRQKNGQKNGNQQANANGNGNNPQQQKGNGQESGQGGDGQTGKNPVADAYKDIWGHLPEKLRQEMDAYGRDQFMAKYQDLLKQYYATIAEKGRKRGE